MPTPPLRPILASLTLALGTVPTAAAKLGILAAYWSAEKRPSETLARTYPKGVLPGVINRIILTHVNFQDFPALEATPAWQANLAEYKNLRAQGVAVWVMITNAQRPCLEPAAAPGYIRDLVDFCVRNGIDGVDIDLEGPESLNHKNFNGFCRDLADALHAKKLGVSMAVQATWTFRSVDNATLAKLDQVLPMAYDETGPWNPKKDGPHATFEYAVRCLAALDKRGVPRSKILLGMPTYGYRFRTENGKRLVNDFGWGDLLKHHPGRRDKDVAGAGPDTAEGAWHYNGLVTVRKKITWAKAQQLAGIGVWHGNMESPGRDSFWLCVRETNR